MERTLLGPRETTFVKKRVAAPTRPVRLLVFRRPECEGCDPLQQLTAEIAQALPAVRAEVVTDDGNPAAAARFEAFGIERVPALAVTAGDGREPDNGIRFYGFPGGYEFDSLLDAIDRVGRGDPGLSADLVRYLGEPGGAPMHVQVFITPTCPYCPRMVQLAHRMALADPRVTADMVDALEFPDLADRYGVQGVPLTVVDDAVFIEGAVPEQHLLQELRDRRSLLQH
jgi:glutaredoxin-like protein